MSYELVAFAAVVFFVLINFYLVWISKSLIFAFETARILRKVGAVLLTLCLLITSLDYADLKLTGLIICVQLLIASWLNIKVAVYSVLRTQALTKEIRMALYIP